MNNITLPDGYKVFKSINLSKDKKLNILLNVLNILIAITMVIIGLFNRPTQLTIDTSILLDYLIILGAIIIYIFLHELTHGIFMRSFSKIRPFYGFKGVFAYAGSKAYFNKKSYVIIALAPAVIWGIILLALNLIFDEWFWFIYIIQIMNVSGSIGDFYVSLLVRKFPSDTLVNDIGVGMTFYTKTY